MKRDSQLDSVASSYKGILQNLGEDPTREGLVNTPMRAAKAIMFFTKGYEETVAECVEVGSQSIMVLLLLLLLQSTFWKMYTSGASPPMVR